MSSSTPVAEVIASAPVVVFAASSSVLKSNFTAPAQDNLTRSQVVVSLLQAGEGRPQGDVEVTDAQKAELRELTGKTSVPQVFVKGQFIGGCNDGGLGGTVPLLKSGKLQEMLQ